MFGAIGDLLTRVIHRGIIWISFLCRVCNFKASMCWSAKDDMLLNTHRLCMRTSIHGWMVRHLKLECAVSVSELWMPWPYHSNYFEANAQFTGSRHMCQAQLVGEQDYRQMTNSDMVILMIPTWVACRRVGKLLPQDVWGFMVRCASVIFQVCLFFFFLVHDLDQVSSFLVLLDLPTPPKNKTTKD